MAGPAPLKRLRDELGMGVGKRYVFIPASFPTIVARGLSSRFAFWRRDSVYHYPTILLSFGLMDRRSNIGQVIRRDAIVWGDSGGFQLASSTVDHIEQADVLRWQVANVDIGFILDKPAFDLASGSATPETWNQSLRFTKRSVDTVLRLYDKLHEEIGRSDKLVLYGIVHGFAPWQLEKYYTEVVEPLLETGVAAGVAVGGLATMKMNSYLIAYWLSFLEHMGARYAHLLGVSAARAEWLLVATKYLKSIELLTTDGSWLTYLLQYGSANYPGSTEFTRLKTLRSKHHSHPYCTCPFCVAYRRTYGSWPWEARSITGDAALALLGHNLFWIVTELAKYSWLVATGWEHPRENLVSDAFDMGYEKYWRRYCRHANDILKSMAGGCQSAGGWW